MKISTGSPNINPKKLTQAMSSSGGEEPKDTVQTGSSKNYIGAAAFGAVKGLAYNYLSGGQWQNAALIGGGVGVVTGGIKGGIAGGVLGGVAGGLVGNEVEKGGEGAIAGAGIGGLGGSILGAGLGAGCGGVKGALYTGATVALATAFGGTPLAAAGAGALVGVVRESF